MEQDCKRISKNDLIGEMKYLSEIYDVVRLVEPDNTEVVKLSGDSLVKAQMEPCFSVWEKDTRCDNCISLRACVENRRMTKFEFRKNEAYYVLAVPYEVEDGETIYKVSMELVNKVSSDFNVNSDGIDQTADLVHAISMKAYEDSLTGTYNRRYFDEKKYMYDHVQNFPKRLGFLMVDVNQFKQTNQIYGHDHGDELLAKIGEVLRRSFRNSDKVIRIGGDEFLIVAKDCNRLFLEKKVAIVKREISDIKFDWMKDFRPSIAVGIAYSDKFSGRKEETDELYKEADEKMLRDKKSPIPVTAAKSILIVDDVAMNRDFIKAELKGKFHLLEAENGRDALVILKSNHVDLIITDIFMDHMNGYDFMKNVRSNPNTKNIPIIAITENSKSSQSKAIVSGADLFIDRTARKELLLRSIIQLTGHDHGRRELFDMDFVLDSIPGAVMVSKFITETPEIIYCSRGIHSIAGVESDEFSELIKRLGPDIIFPADFPKFMKCVKGIIETHTRGDIIFRSYQNDGSLIWLWMQGRYIGDEDGYPILEQIVLDVSNSTNMYESILDEASSLITVVGEDNLEVLYANKKSKEILGHANGAKCYDTIFDYHDKCDDCAFHVNNPEDLERVFELDGHFYKQTFKKILWNRRNAMLECMDDITEQKKLQRYTEQEKDTLNQIVQNVPAGLFVFNFEKDKSLKLVEANPSACQLMGIDFTKTIGSGSEQVFELTHPEDRPLIADTIRKLQVPGRTVHYEYRQYNKLKKEYCWLSAMGHSVLQPDGEISIYVSYFDITEQKKAQKLKEDLRIAQNENQAKTDFMSNMSHDMRTPLNGILGLAHLMTEKDNVEELHEDAKQLVISGKLLLNLINDTLDMNKIESGKLALNLMPMDSASVFENVISTVSIFAAQAGVSIDLHVPDIPKEQWVTVISDASRIEQILINVISNAIKYSNVGETVELYMTSVSITEDEVVDQYRIVDHGIGMSEEFLPHLFEPFVQEGRMNTTRTQGSGLGMSIVKHLVDLLGGEIKVESKLNEGTTVTLLMRYPVYKGAVESKQEQRQDHGNLSGMHVLVCEDHPLNQQIVTELLKRRDIIVDVAANGKEGLENFEKSEEGYYDLILMDVRMPVMDGIAAAKAIRGLDRKDALIIPIIAMTANAFTEDKEETKNAGMNEHLAKPVDPELLYEKLGEYYEKRS